MILRYNIYYNSLETECSVHIGYFLFFLFFFCKKQCNPNLLQTPCKSSKLQCSHCLAKSNTLECKAGEFCRNFEKHFTLSLCRYPDTSYRCLVNVFQVYLFPCFHENCTSPFQLLFTFRDQYFLSFLLITAIVFEILLHTFVVQEFLFSPNSSKIRGTFYLYASAKNSEEQQPLFIHKIFYFNSTKVSRSTHFFSLFFFFRYLKISRIQLSQIVAKMSTTVCFLLLSLCCIARIQFNSFGSAIETSVA